MLEQNLRELPLVIQESFYIWGEKCKRYAPIFNTIPRDVMQIAFDAFTEIKYLVPGSFELWWATSHNRYIRKFKQKDISKVQELIYNFLIDLSSGRLNKDEAFKMEKRPRGRPRKEM